MKVTATGVRSLKLSCNLKVKSNYIQISLIEITSNSEDLIAYSRWILFLYIFYITYKDNESTRRMSFNNL